MTRLLLAVLILGGAIALAQEEDAAQSTPEPTADTEEVTAGDSGAEPRRDESPFDYEASEQISEDLSVSFPVDI
jgi:hypothetical protein